eukprot:366132-Chlamydomonas_euryale.AAC.7
MLLHQRLSRCAIGTACPLRKFELQRQPSYLRIATPGMHARHLRHANKQRDTCLQGGRACSEAAWRVVGHPGGRPTTLFSGPP